MIKPKDLLHELEQGERIGEDIKRFLMQMNFPSTPNDAWRFASTTSSSSIFASSVMPWSRDD